MCELMISKFCHIAIGNVKKNWCLTLLKKKNMCFFMKTYNFIQGQDLKLRKNTLCIRIQSITMAKIIIQT